MTRWTVLGLVCGLLGSYAVSRRLWSRREPADAFHKAQWPTREPRGVIHFPKRGQMLRDELVALGQSREAR